MTTPICHVYEVPAYRQCQSDEGYYDRQVGFHVLAKVLTPEGLLEEYLYTGEGDLFEVFDRDGAERLVERVRAAGAIDPTFWFVTSVSDPQALPDYVVNWHLPEYN